MIWSLCSDNYKSPRFYCFVVLCLFGISLLPLLVNHYPPIVDHPLHAARLHLLSSFDSDSFIRENFRSTSWNVPYLGLEIIALPMMKIFTLETAMDIFIGIHFALLFFGTIVLHRVLFGRLYYWPLVSAYFFFNHILVWGFYSYLLGVGLLLWGLIGWLCLLRSSVLIRVGYLVTVGLCFYFVHLSSFMLFFYVLFFFELQDVWQTRPFIGIKRVLVRIFLLMASLVLPVIFFVGSSSVSLFGINDAEMTAVHDFVLKAKALLYLGSSGCTWIDMLFLFLMFCLFVMAIKHIRFGFARRLGLVLVATLVLFLLLPFSANNQPFLDYRIPVLLVFLTIASTNVRFDDKFRGNVFYFILFSLIVSRVLLIGWEWSRFDTDVDQYIKSFGQLDAGSTLFQAVQGSERKSFMGFNKSRKTQLASHVGEYAAIVNSVFSPALHLDGKKTPITFAVKNEGVKRLQQRDPKLLRSQISFDLFVDRIRAAHSAVSPNATAYLLIIHEGSFGFTLPIGVKIVSRGDNFHILEIFTPEDFLQNSGAGGGNPNKGLNRGALSRQVSTPVFLFCCSE